jgi:hypothetical protein
VKEGEGYVVAVAVAVAVVDVKEGAVVDDVVVVGDDAKMDVAAVAAVAVVAVVACNHLDQLLFDLLVLVR